MKYQIGDRFLVQGIPCEIKYINNDKAWVFPLDVEEQGNGNTLNPCIAFEVINKKGLDSKGNKVYSLLNYESMAV